MAKFIRFISAAERETYFPHDTLSWILRKVKLVVKLLEILPAILLL